MTVVYAIDVGSPRAGLAWARLQIGDAAVSAVGEGLPEIAKRVAADLREGHLVALGFEAPGVLPVPDAVGELVKARTGEVRGGTSRPWCFGPGAYVTTIVLQVGAWLLREIGRAVPDAVRRATLRPELWGPERPLLLWEAFVSGPGHARGATKDGVSEHVQDAMTAVSSFRDWLMTEPRPASAVTVTNPLATFGAIALWADWGSSADLLHQPPLVLWPSSAGEAPNPLAAPPKHAPPVTHEAQAPTHAAGEFALLCGDSHCIWRSHQQAAGREAFESLVAVLRASPGHAVEAEIRTSAVGAQPIKLRLIGENQLSWKGVHLNGSAAAKVPVLVRVKSSA